MWTSVSWNPTQKEGGLLAKVVPKHEHRNYVDPLASNPKRGNVVLELGDIFWTLFTILAL